MGVHSTLSITREKAQDIIAAHIKNESNKILADMVSDIWYDDLYNCMIVPEGKEDTFSCPCDGTRHSYEGL